MIWPIQQRLLAAALTDRLVYGSEAGFHAEDAVELHEMLPAPSPGERLRALLPGISATGRTQGSGFRGVAAGAGGDVRIEGAGQDFAFDLHGRPVYRAGQWKLTRTADMLDGLRGRSLLTITQVMGEAEDELEVRIPFRRGHPQVMERSVMASVTFGGVTLGRVTFRPWKAPVWGRRPPDDPCGSGRAPGRDGRADPPG